MKKFFVSLILLLPLGLAAQNPACTQKGSLTTATTFTALTNNTANPTCNAFALTWTSTGFTAIAIQLQGADTLAGTYTAFSGTSTVIVGSNPATSLSGAIVVQASAKLAFLQVKLNSVTGSGAVNFQLYGYNGVTAAVASVGGGASCGALGGDLSGTCAAATVVGVNGATVALSAPVVASNGSRQLIAATTTGTGSTAVLSVSPALTGTPTAPTQTPGDNTTKLATDAFVQAAISAFSVPFSLISGGTNTTATMNCGTGCFMTFGGSGAINANEINGTAIATANTPVLATNGGDQIVAGTMTGTGSTVVMQTSPTITTPTIADLTNSQHTHANAAGGGQLDNTAVKTANKAGAGTLFAMTTALGGSGNCANWNANGIGDSGSPCGSGGGGGGGVVTYSGPTLSILSGTAYCPIGGGGSCSATETNVDIDSPATATVSKMYVQLSQALGAGNSVAVTWRANASSQTVTCTISGASATSCNDTTHSFTATTGDLLTYQLVFTGTIIVTPTITIASAFGTSNVGVTSVTATAPIVSTGGTTPVISCPTCSTSAGGTTWNAPASITSLPSCTSSVYFQPFTDAAYNYGYCNGSSVFSYYWQGFAVTPPTGTFAWTNQCSGCTVTKQTNGSWFFVFPSHGATSDSNSVYDTNITAAPSSNIMRFIPFVTAASSAPQIGVLLRESGTGKLIVIGFNQNASGSTCSNGIPCINVQTWNSTTSFAARVGSTAVSLSAGIVLTVKIEVASGAAGNITVSWSQDAGIDYTTLYQAPKNAFFTTAPDKIGVVGNNNFNGNPDAYLTLIGTN
jgi:hypothetical protein